MFQDYLFPESISEAVHLLKTNHGNARIIGGGTDLILDLQRGKYQTKYLVDISRIQELKQISEENGKIVLGAAVTHNQAAESELVQSGAAALALASAAVGSYQIRNLSTVAGNVVNAQPAADSAVALVALAGQAKIIDTDGVSTVPVESLYAGVGKSTVDSTTCLITTILVEKAKPGEGSGFSRLAQRKALALPMLNVAAMVSIQNGQLALVRIAMAPVGVGPVRAAHAEAFLKGQVPSHIVLQKAGQLALENANPRDSLVRGSRDYRLKVLPILVRKALEQAIANAERGVL